MDATEKQVEYGLPATFSPAPDQVITVDADETTGFAVISLTTGGWAPVAIALDSTDAMHVIGAISAARRLLAGTSFDMHRRESGDGSAGAH